eukprot:GHVU01041779.1.p1 GENE.GHVU01041779.1~~GHVU01041779.1.p1  ORF type:complete len:463 (-),score=90.05 GHVU01041779.1:887-2275(-)
MQNIVLQIPSGAAPAARRRDESTSSRSSAQSSNHGMSAAEIELERANIADLRKNMDVELQANCRAYQGVVGSILKQPGNKGAVTQYFASTTGYVIDEKEILRGKGELTRFQVDPIYKACIDTIYGPNELSRRDTVQEEISGTMQHMSRAITDARIYRLMLDIADRLLMPDGAFKYSDVYLPKKDRLEMLLTYWMSYYMWRQKAMAKHVERLNQAVESHKTLWEDNNSTLGATEMHLMRLQALTQTDAELEKQERKLHGKELLREGYSAEINSLRKIIDSGVAPTGSTDKTVEAQVQEHDKQRRALKNWDTLAEVETEGSNVLYEYTRSRDIVHMLSSVGTWEKSITDKQSGIKDVVEKLMAPETEKGDNAAIEAKIKELDAESDRLMKDVKKVVVALNTARKDFDQRVWRIAATLPEPWPAAMGAGRNTIDMKIEQLFLVQKNLDAARKEMTNIYFDRQRKK